MTTPKSLPFLFRSVLVVAALFVGATAFNPAWAQDLSTHDVEREANAGNFEKAYEALVQLAESGNAQAQGFLAYVLYQGEWGVPVDEAKAKAWMQSALEQNDAYAHLFVALTNMPDVAEENANDPSLIVSHDWKANIRIAAENGHPYAQHMMGDWAKEQYLYKEAIDWYGMAAHLDRDYYAVDKYLTQSLFTWPRRFLIEEIEPRVTSGNVEAYAALHSAYTFGFRVKYDYRKAYGYGVMSKFYDLMPSDKATKQINENVSEVDQKALADEASQRLFSWIQDENTYVGQASAWCIEDGKFSLHCIKNAVEDHRLCEAEYMMWNFKNIIEFPAYKACRDYYDEYPPLN